MPKAQSPTAAPAKRRPGKLFRRFRRTVRALFITAVLFAVALVVLTQGPVPRWLIGRAVRGSTGAEFNASWVSLKLDGRLIASDVSLRVPAGDGLPTDAAEIASARRVEVDIDWSGWGAGVVTPRTVRVVSPLLRASINSTTGELNVSRLTAGTPSTGVSRMPRIEIVGGTLLLGEHDESVMTELNRLTAQGWISPVFGTRSYLVRLTMSDRDDPGLAVTALGTLDLAQGTGEINATGLDLARLTGERVPTALRDLWNSLRLRGRIDTTSLRYTPDTGLDTTVRLLDVSLNAPIASGRTEITGSRSPRMEGVSGELRIIGKGVQAGLRAELSGLFEDLPARLRFASRGLSIDAGYDAVLLAERFQLEKDPRILWFAPGVVQRNFEKFSGPTAVIDARIEVSRARPEGEGKPGEVSIAGSLVFENGQAAYEKFPYPMTGMSGTVRFDDTRVQIVGIQGRGPTGARIFAEGVIEPPNENSRYDIRVTATDVPMDGVLRGAILGSAGASLVDAVFSQKRFEELRSLGLVRKRSDVPGDGGDAPEFAAFSGTIDSIQVHVTSAFGKSEPVHQDIAVRFKEVNALPELFPYPITGKDVALRIGDDFIEAQADGVTGLYGGRATIQARVDILKASGENPTVYVPTVTVRSEGIPIEPLLINALPDETDAKPGDFSVKKVLSGLNLDGPVDAVIKVKPDPVKGPRATPLVEASILFEGVKAAPLHPAGSDSLGLTIEEMIGAIRAGSEGISIDSLEARLWPVLPAGGEGPPVSSWVRIDGEWSAGTSQAPSWLTLRARDIDLRLALEDVLRPIMPEAASSVTDLRSGLKPTGRTDVEMRIDRASPSAEIRLRAEASRAVNLQALLGEQRVGIVQRNGTLGIDVAFAVPQGQAAPPMRASLRDLVAQLRVDDQDVGVIEASGVISPPRDATATTSAAPLLVHEPVRLELEGLQLHSPIVRTMVERFGGSAAGEVLTTYKPTGVIDGEVRLEAPPSAPQDWKPWIALRPRWLEIDRPREGGTDRLRLPLISGQVTVEPAGEARGQHGLLEELVVINEGWSARINGAWSRGEPTEHGTPLTLAGTVALETYGLPPSLLDLLPGGVRESIEGAQVRLYGGIEAPAILIQASHDGNPQSPMLYALSGDANFSGLYADPGVKIADARGTITLRAERTLGSPSRTEIGLSEGLLRLAGLRIEHAAGALLLDGQGVRVPQITADAYGGRLWLTALLEEGGEGPGRYRGEVQLAGVRFADIVADLRRNRASQEGPVLPIDAPLPTEGDPAELQPVAPDGSRGLLEARLALSGIRGDASSRRGTGEVRIGGGRAVLELPTVGTILALASLNLPSSAPFDFAHADVHLEGDRLVFERAALLSDDLALLGAGSLNLQSLQLDLRATGRSRARVPLLTDLMDALRDEVITVRLRGTPDRPEVGFENFAAVRSAFRGRRSPLIEALETDLERLERDRQRGWSGAVFP